MVDLRREGLGLLLKWMRSIAKSEDSTEVPEEPQVLASVNAEAEPMKAYWESDKENLDEKQQPYLDLFLKDVALERIPDATEEPTKESHYNFDRLSLVYLPEAVKNFNVQGNV